MSLSSRYRLLLDGIPDVIARGRGLKKGGRSGAAGDRYEARGEWRSAGVEAVKLLGDGLGGARDKAGGVAAEFAASRSFWIMAGFSKSQGTPCFEQWPHLGWVSSH